MKKVDSLLRKEVTILGANGLFGKITSKLLKQSSSVDVLNLFDYKNVQKGDELESIKGNCQIKYHSGKESIGDALKSADIIVVSDVMTKGSSFFNPQAEFLYKAPTVVDFAAKIAGCNSAAIIVVATSPINFTLPLLNGVLDKLGKLDVGKVLGMTNVDIIRANSLFASHLHINPKNVWLPVVGGSSQETRVPLFSKAKPPQTMNLAMWQKITSEIKKYDLKMGRTNCEDEMANRAYATSQLICAILAGLGGKKGVVETVMSQQELVKGTSFFSLPVLLGEEGIKKRIALPSVTGYESSLLAHAIKSLATETNLAMEYLRSNVNIEELKINSRINKLSDLEVSSRKNYEFEGRKNVIHKKTKKDKYAVNIKNVFSLKELPPEVESVKQNLLMKALNLLTQSKVLHKPVTRKEVKNTVLNKQNMEGNDSVLPSTTPTEIIKIKNNENSINVTNLAARNIKHKPQEYKNKEMKTVTTCKSGQDVQKPKEVFDIDEVLQSSYLKDEVPPLSKSASTNSIKVGNIPVGFSPISDQCSDKKEFNKQSKGNETIDVGNTINLEDQHVGSSFGKQSFLENHEVMTIGETKKININTELPEKAEAQKNSKRTGRIPPPEPDRTENNTMINKTIIPIDDLENYTATKNNNKLIDDNINSSRTSTADEESHLLENSKNVDLINKFSNSDSKKPCSFKNHNYSMKTSSKEEGTSFLSIKETSEITDKEKSTEYVIFYPPISECKEDYDIEKNNDKTETESPEEPDEGTAIKMQENEKISQPEPSSKQENKDEKTLQAPVSEGNNPSQPVLKKNLNEPVKNLDSNEENINSSETKDTILSNEKTNYENNSFDKKQELYCCTKTDGFRLHLPQKNMMSGETFKTIQDRFAYFPITDCARFMSSKPLSKEVNDVTDNVDKNKYKPQAEQIWKAFKNKRNYIANENFITQEGPAATLLKKRNSPIANVKLAHELRRLNNDETSLTRKLQEKQKKLIVSLRNNVSFDKDKAETPLSIKTNADNFKKNDDVQSPDFINSFKIKNQKKLELETIKKLGKNCVPVNEEYIETKEDIKKANNLPSKNNTLSEQKKLKEVHPAQNCNEQQKNYTKFEMPKLFKKNCSMADTTQNVNSGDADSKQNLNGFVKPLENSSKITNKYHSEKVIDAICEVDSKSKRITVSSNSDSERSKSLPATVLESIECNKEEQYLNKHGLITHEETNPKKDTALLIVSPENCESSNIKC